MTGVAEFFLRPAVGEITKLVLLLQDAGIEDRIVHRLEDVRIWLSDPEIIAAIEEATQ